MTDLATRPDADEERAHDAASSTGDGDASEYQWAPAEPAAPKKRALLWIGLPAGATAVALVAASLVLIAPGTTVAGVNVGGFTAGAAADAISERLAETTLVLEGPAGEFQVTGADLGATVDATAAAEAAFSEHPLWNPTTWFPAGIDVPVTLDESRATEALRAVAGDLYVDPVDAAVSFDPASASYVVTEAQTGEGIDLTAVQEGLQGAFDSGATTTSLEAAIAPVEAAATTEEATAIATSLNDMLDVVGFYVGEERTVPVDRAVAASWLSVTAEDGAFAIAADPAAIQPVVDALPAAVNREPVNATVITDTAGEVLREQTAGVTGRALGSTDGIAEQFAGMLNEGQAVFPLTVTETEFATTALVRRIDVNLSAQRTTLFENDQVVQSWSMSSGLPGSPTLPGSFRIGWKTPMQDMGCFPGAPYCTENVPWVSYFNGDQAFHGAYWHNNFGNVMSHGCVNLPVSAAKFIYDWAPQGTQVSVHY
ncbi:MULTISPECIES: L,D-transpeptidase family protein [Microbacterium]|uniref:Murein L,D-transpeptidase n=1 Tax=Microbacterium wangchenii TaxID=2541726 RepID=A0ABX5SSW6_9MICO|nr:MULTISPECIES: L,D-transpeptidase family protein [Microbacterium]MCK6066630.1 L,D-transpeptidase/peptidoglycan binding protein [Microbacterium sp. EYE_512]QBR87964.1 murein L,D-transpeptidase [Microbacterium wangchenii]TXK18246.1 L,D-transpeptidase family protein [Microbacterium wangchenii]